MRHEPLDSLLALDSFEVAFAGRAIAPLAHDEKDLAVLERALDAQAPGGAFPRPREVPARRGDRWQGAEAISLTASPLPRYPPVAMSMTLFTTLYRELGEAETRTLIAVNHPDLPPDRYAFAESYCDTRGCDCRRVILNVIAMGAKKHVATIAHALDDAKPRFGLPRTFLDPMNKQTSLSQTLLDEFIRTILPDPAYQARLLRHYEMFKAAVERPGHATPPALQGAAPARSIPREGPKVGRNDPCPCGSGIKYKKCCLSAG